MADGGQVTYYAAPRPAVTGPHQVGVLPRQANCFQKRVPLGESEQPVRGVDSAMPMSCQVLVGMGGVGKTQLAASYARRAWAADSIDLLVWVTAATRSAVVAAYAQAAAEINLPVVSSAESPERAAEAFLAWLEAKAVAEPCRWLVVLDDVSNPADLQGLWPPNSPYGHTLITTRRRDAALTGPARRIVPLDLFTPEEATAYVTDVLAVHGQVEPSDEVAALAADLGNLPLALSQAAAYLIDAGLGVAAYRALLASRSQALAAVLPEPSSLPDDQTLSTAAVWSLSIERADRLRPQGLARPMLHLAAMLDPNGIPSSILTGDPALAYLTEHRSAVTHIDQDTGPTIPVTPEEAAGALRALHRLSLVDHSPTEPHQTIRVHQLIQRATRDTLGTRLCRTAALADADALLAAWPEIERDTDLAQALRANTEALTRHAEPALFQPSMHQVLHRIGRSLASSGQASAARQHYQRLAATAEGHLGPAHRDALTARRTLAEWRGMTGDVLGAIAALEQLVIDQEQLLAPDDRDTLTTRGRLISWRDTRRDAPPADTVTAYERLLTDQARHLGPDDRDTLTTRRFLASVRGRAGDTTGAIAAYQELLTDQEQHLGADDRDPLFTRSLLANARGRAGDTTGAIAAYQELLTDQEQHLGADDFDPLFTRERIADWRGRAGDLPRAITGYEEVVVRLEQVMGPDHINTLGARSQLAQWRGRAGDATGASTAYEALLTQQTGLWGPSLYTLATRSCIVAWRSLAGDEAGSHAAYEQLLSERERVLGSGHFIVLVSINVYRWSTDAADATSAIAALDTLLTEHKERLGPGCLVVLAARPQFVSWHTHDEHSVDITNIFERMLNDLGPDHPHTPILRDKLNQWRQATENRA
ncbi:tetratricopeptide repeat protein [Streptomyces sp. NBC_01341]|uniref:tetratricopeptide repeat protein n=1 Tax=Streptomyces sp. NBC_01341 TaxID=2903831 RepID=UPI002E121AE2|nr:tetratricopeptide repeat protein [Streptomyces sp. NBC_01341]